VLGAALDIFDFARQIVERELGAVSDNPLVFDHAPDRERQIVSAGNFHGMPLAAALDTATLGLAYVAGIAERRVYYILAASDAENPLHPHLSPIPGLHSGLMISQYVAAACCNEIVTLTLPSSAFNIPTSAGMEDYNSFGATSASKFRRALARATDVIAIELLCAAEALEYQRPLRSGDGVENAHELVRSVVSRRTADRPPSPDIAAIAGLIRAGAFTA
jgi:histidine ammonia-lyase